MGGGGVEVEIASGKPRETKTPEQRQAEADLQKQQAEVERLNLLADLQDSPGLILVFQAFLDRLKELATADPQCQAFTKILVGWRSKLDPVSLGAQHMARHALGPQLRSVLRVIEKDSE
jgi:hypothetical protein